MRSRNAIRAMYLTIVSTVTSLLVGGHASFGLTVGGVVGGDPGGVPGGLTTPIAAPSVRLTPAAFPSVGIPAPDFDLLDTCPNSRGTVRESQIRPLCGGSVPRVDEIYTIFTNTVLQRTCGRFITHFKPGNAGLEFTHNVAVAPGADPLKLTERGDGWVLALRGCNLDQIDSVKVEGVPAEVIPAAAIKEWHVPLATAVDQGGNQIGINSGFTARNTVAFVRFIPPAAAHFHEDRPLTVLYKNGGAQELKRIKLALADNGTVRTLTVQDEFGPRVPAQVRWAEESTLDLGGTQLRRPRLRAGEGGCVESGQVGTNSESAFRVNATFDCPIAVREDDGSDTIVTARFCKCGMLAYDASLDVYLDSEISKQRFNYIRQPLDVVANLDKMNEKPAVIGDSLSHGIMGAGLAPRSQAWAYPHLVVAQMGGRPLRQNRFYMSNIEDGVKDAFELVALPEKFGPPAEPNHQDPTIEGFVDEDSGLHEGELTTSPLHVGVDGFDYTNVLYTSGQKLDVRGDGRWRDGVERPPCVCPDICNEDGTPKDVEDGGAGVGQARMPRPAAQLALGCGTRTPIETLEAERPTFIFASAAQNHVLACATKMLGEDDCLERERFERDAAEVFRRLRKIGSIKGGIVFGIPPIASIPYFASNGDGSLRAFYQRRDQATRDVQVLSAAELTEVNQFIADANEYLKGLAETNQYAFADSSASFERLRVEGEPIMNGPQSTTVLCNAKTRLPLETLNRGPEDEPQNAGLDAGCGIIGPDAVHPNQLGQSVMANELLRTINTYYRFNVPVLTPKTLFETWSADSLNQDPMDMVSFMTTDLTLECGLDLGAAVAAVAGGGACLLTGSLCLESAALAAAAISSSDACRTAVIQLIVRNQFIKTLEETPEPQVCWPDQEHAYDGC